MSDDLRDFPFYAQLKRALRRITTDISGHVAAADPHPSYMTSAETATAILATKLDDLTAPDDNTDLDASTTKHGLLKKLPNTATTRLDGQGNFVAYTVRAGSGAPSGAPTGTELPIAVDTDVGTGGVYYWTGAAWVLAGVGP